jgi:hypothetical protein
VFAEVGCRRMPKSKGEENICFDATTIIVLLNDDHRLYQYRSYSSYKFIIHDAGLSQLSKYPSQGTFVFVLTALTAESISESIFIVVVVAVLEVVELK